MRFRCATTLVIAALASIAGGLSAQDRKILSPRDSVFLRFDTSVVSVNYSRPSMRGRRIMGDLVPWDKVWRTGANQATHLRTTTAITMGGVPVPRGSYTLWTLPSRKGWKVILNKQTGQWGTEYDERQDLARFNAQVSTVPVPVESLTVSLDPTGKSSGILKLVWEQTVVKVPFELAVRPRMLSPLDSAQITLNGHRVLVRYSRPYLRGRKVWGTVVPLDSVWRTGANLATAFEAGSDLIVGSAHVPRGSYTLYSIPSSQSLTLIISKKPGGTEPEYDASQDLARITMKFKRISTPVDPFTIALTPEGPGKATLSIAWSDRSFTTTIAAK